MEKKDNTNIYSAVTLDIRGLHCESCVGRVETALLLLAGVADAEVDLAEHKAKITYDSVRVSIDDLIACVEAEGYFIFGDNIKGPKPNMECCNQSFSWFSNPRSYLYGALASIAIMNTHSGDLSQDLVAACTLKDNSGREYHPTSWDGSPPGGHHRSGVLEFSELGEGAESITLVIRAVDNVPERVFNWSIER